MAALKWNRDFYFSHLETRPNSPSLDKCPTSIHRLVIVRASSADEAECILVEKWRIQNKYPKGWNLELVELSRREYQTMVRISNEVPA